MAQRIRLHPEQLEQLKKEVAHSNDGTVDTRISLSDVVRALLDEALRARALARSVKSDSKSKEIPSQESAAQKASVVETKQPKENAPQRPRTRTLNAAVIGALGAAGIPGKDLINVADVIRTLESLGYLRGLIHLELERLGSASVAVIELLPASGNGNERVQGIDTVPLGRDRKPLLYARWKKRP